MLHYVHQLVSNCVCLLFAAAGHRAELVIILCGFLSTSNHFDTQVVISSIVNMKILILAALICLLSIVLAGLISCSTIDLYL